MFLLDLYRFCESWRQFNRQHLARFVFGHRECERLAMAAGVTPRFFASMISKECMARWCTLGYLDIEKGVARAKGPDKRPSGYEFETFKGRDSRYMLEMMNIGKLDDSALFGRQGRGDDNGGTSDCLRESDHTRAILACRAQLASHGNVSDKDEGAQPT